MKVNRILSFLLTMMLVLCSLCGNLVNAAPTSGIEIVLDKSKASVGEIVTASINVNNINNFSGCHINLKYDPEILQPVTSNGVAYKNTTVPEAGTILKNIDFGINSIASNKIEEGILNFSRSYLNLNAYREEGDPESTGTVAVIRFKVLKEEESSIRFEESSTMPNSVNGTFLFNWYGERIYSGYTVGQAQTINYNEQDSSYITMSFDKNNAEVGEIITATLKVNKIAELAGYQVNIKYDPTVLQAVNPNTGKAYTNITNPLSGELFTSEDYGILSNASNNIDAGILNFSRSYLNLKIYREDGIAEETGTVAVIGFKVLQQKETSILFEDTIGMPNAITGTVLFDWHGSKIESGYTVIQPEKINAESSTPVRNSYITMTFDKNTAEVGEIITATLRVNEIANLAGYQVNIKYDPTVLQAINPTTGKVFKDSSVPSSGELFTSQDYSPIPAASNNIDAGILNFSRAYMDLETYREDGVAEETGTIAVIGFKVLQQKETSILFENAIGMPNGITGTSLIDWYGDRIESGYTVIQPEKINAELPTPTSTPKVTPTPTTTPETTPTPTSTPKVTPTPTTTPEVTPTPTSTPETTPTPTTTPETTATPTSTPEATPTSTPTSNSYITIDLDKTEAYVGDVIIASVRVNDIRSLSGYQVNIKYDPNVLKAVDPITRTPYSNKTLPLDGELLINTDYSVYSQAESNIDEGILNFSKNYINLKAYKESNEPEESGTIFVLGFEVLEAKNTTIKFEDTLTMPNAIEGTMLFDWDGYRIEESYSVIQPAEITISEAPAPNFIYGDVDGNGSVRINDAVLIRDYVLGKIDEFPYEYGMLAADVDGNGSIRINDYVLVRDYVLGKISLFPVEEK